ncbi:MAG: DUF131 domain-containing protein [Methanomassiliicoccales archaeon]|nr:MAG: DUF131 domain-containing protein [Methanomassiliicoccales archaeon]
MNYLRTVGKVMFFFGMVCMAIALLGGEFEIGLFMMFLPVLIAKTFLSTLAVLLIFFGMMTWIFGMLDDARTREEVSHLLEKGLDGSCQNGEDKIKCATSGVVLIGPILIVWDSDYRMILLAVVIVMVMLSSMLLLYFR